MESCLLLLLLALADKFLPVFSTDVLTASGPVRGTEIEFKGLNVDQYLGIPFAKPPINDLRFKKPEPVEPWTNTYVADTMPPGCMQYRDIISPDYDSQDGKSEDCLYLNIWVPHCAKKVPVMFWIYGGTFEVGSNRIPLYEGRALAALGQVAVLTINYRVNAFGFLSSGTDDAPGNVGIYDVVAALKWTKDNIMQFGGDCDQITLFGQSAGSIICGALCISPLTTGMFQRVIMESGSPAYLFENTNVEKTQQLAEALSCADERTTIYNNPSAVIDCLRKVDAMELVKTLSSIQSSDPTFYPVIGDELFPEDPIKALVNGDFQDVDVLIGNNKDEGSSELTSYNPKLFGIYGEKEFRINKSYGEDILRNVFMNFDDRDAVIQHYLGNLDSDDYDQILHNVYTAIGDFSFLCPSVYFAEVYSKSGSNVYYYFFTHRPSTTYWAEWMGVAHFDEIQFVFGLPLQYLGNYTKTEVKLSEKMIQIWSNFTKFGKPNGIWPKYSQNVPSYIELNTENGIQYGEGPHKENCDFFRKYFGFD